MESFGESAGASSLSGSGVRDFRGDEEREDGLGVEPESEIVWVIESVACKVVVVLVFEHDIPDGGDVSDGNSRSFELEENVPIFVEHLPRSVDPFAVADHRGDEYDFRVGGEVAEFIEESPVLSSEPFGIPSADVVHPVSDDDQMGVCGEQIFEVVDSIGDAPAWHSPVDKRDFGVAGGLQLHGDEVGVGRHVGGRIGDPRGIETGGDAVTGDSESQRGVIAESFKSFGE